METVNVTANQVEVKATNKFTRNYKPYFISIGGFKLIGSETGELSEATRIKDVCVAEINNGQYIRVMSDNECIVMPKF